MTEEGTVWHHPDDDPYCLVTLYSSGRAVCQYEPFCLATVDDLTKEELVARGFRLIGTVKSVRTPAGEWQ